jgi:NAD(P)-dependent dehydrogenase (short-subunit alcohol dehydrogenase family)
MTAGGALEARVALITGAGRGIGRAHALELAARGATVMVNDLGAALDGTGSDPGPALAVVEEIRRRGGRARADTTDVASVAGGRTAVAKTLDAFGRIDIVVNNAGFHARGGSLERPDEAAYDAQLDIHLKAALGTTSGAFPQMKQRRWGRIINTVSEVALDPRFPGGGAYAAAKAALWAFTLSAAREAQPHGVTVNAISPGAATRMSRAVLGEDRGAVFRGGASGDLDLDPAHVARLVAYLCSAGAADVNGRILHVAAGQIREYSTQRSGRSELARRIAAILSAPAATG